MNELTFLRDFLRQLRIDCVLDVGANRGQFARELRGIGYNGRIISFEPIGNEFLVLKEQFKNDLKWSGHQVALGSKEETMPITIPKLTVMSSLLDSAAADRDARKELVEVRRLDNMLPSLMTDFESSRVFLKMDTQGYDLEVFRGASGCIENIQGMQSELSIQPLYKNMPHYLEALEAYEAAGFALYNLSVVNRVSDGGLVELNCFMRRAS
ncbi:MAG: FkbM family methyltransferase [Casimicrobiaceae bacterium]